MLKYFVKEKPLRAPLNTYFFEKKMGFIHVFAPRAP
jgi:hypothetical protein